MTDIHCTFFLFQYNLDQFGFERKFETQDLEQIHDVKRIPNSIFTFTHVLVTVCLGSSQKQKSSLWTVGHLGKFQPSTMTRNAYLGGGVQICFNEMDGNLFYSF